MHCVCCVFSCLLVLLVPVAMGESLLVYLPHDLRGCILHHLDIDALAAVSCTCHTLRDAVISYLNTFAYCDTPHPHGRYDDLSHRRFEVMRRTFCDHCGPYVLGRLERQNRKEEPAMMRIYQAWEKAVRGNFFNNVVLVSRARSSYFPIPFRWCADMMNGVQVLTMVGAFSFPPKGFCGPLRKLRMVGGQIAWGKEGRGVLQEIHLDKSSTVWVSGASSHRLSALTLCQQVRPSKLEQMVLRSRCLNIRVNHPEVVSVLGRAEVDRIMILTMQRQRDSVRQMVLDTPTLHCTPVLIVPGELCCPFDPVFINPDASLQAQGEMYSQAMHFARMFLAQLTDSKPTESFRRWRGSVQHLELLDQFMQLSPLRIFLDEVGMMVRLQGAPAVWRAMVAMCEQPSLYASRYERDRLERPANLFPHVLQSIYARNSPSRPTGARELVGIMIASGEGATTLCVVQALRAAEQLGTLSDARSVHELESGDTVEWAGCEGERERWGVVYDLLPTWRLHHRSPPETLTASLTRLALETLSLRTLRHCFRNGIRIPTRLLKRPLLRYTRCTGKLRELLLAVVKEVVGHDSKPAQNRMLRRCFKAVTDYEHKHGSCHEKVSHIPCRSLVEVAVALNMLDVVKILLPHDSRRAVARFAARMGRADIVRYLFDGMSTVWDPHFNTRLLVASVRSFCIETFHAVCEWLVRTEQPLNPVIYDLEPLFPKLTLHPKRFMFFLGLKDAFESILPHVPYTSSRVIARICTYLREFAGDDDSK